MRTLSIRQPFAEMILRGMKTVEYRTRPTRIIGERFWIYASKGKSQNPQASSQTLNLWSGDLVVPDEPLAPWMIELAEGLRMWKPGELPSGVIVGSAVISDCTVHPSAYNARPLYEWHLTGIERLHDPRKPARQPQPAWFNPF